MSRITPLVALLAGAFCALSAAETPKTVSLPASAILQAAPPQNAASPASPEDAPGASFERVNRLQADIRAAKELRRLSVDLAKLTDEVYHMVLDPRGLEDLAWKISIISRKTEAALDRTRKLPQDAVKDPGFLRAAEGFLKSAEDLLNEFRRLEISVPRIQEQIGYANEDSRRFAEEAGDAKQSAAKIADEAQSLLSRVK